MSDNRSIQSLHDRDLSYTKEMLQDWPPETLVDHIISLQESFRRPRYVSTIGVQTEPAVVDKMPNIAFISLDPLAERDPEKFRGVLRRTIAAMRAAIESQLRSRVHPPSGNVLNWSYETFVPSLDVIREVFQIEDKDVGRGGVVMTLDKFRGVCSWNLKVSIVRCPVLHGFVQKTNDVAAWAGAFGP
jgi:hypothetical protein